MRTTVLNRSSNPPIIPHPPPNRPLLDGLKIPTNPLRPPPLRRNPQQPIFINLFLCVFQIGICSANQGLAQVLEAMLDMVGIVVLVAGAEKRFYEGVWCECGGGVVLVAAGGGIEFYVRRA